MSSPGGQSDGGQQNDKLTALPKPPRSPGQSSFRTASPVTIGQATPPSPIHFDFASNVNAQDLLEIAACPCCKQCIDDGKHQTLAGRKMIADPYMSLADNDESMSDDEDSEDGKLPGGVAEGLKYHPKRILAEGWLHKKGTGNDWMGSKSWKPRWARLVMAKLEGFEVDVPLLMVYWYQGTSSPSNVIILDSTVAFPIDLEEKERWDAFRFDIRNARSAATNNTVNRTFCAPKKARDAWLVAFNEALLMFEKNKDKARKEARRVTPQPVQYRPTSPSFEEVWSEDRFPSKGSPKMGSSSPPRMPSPPTSPQSRKSRPPTARKPVQRSSLSKSLSVPPKPTQLKKSVSS